MAFTPTVPPSTDVPGPAVSTSLTTFQITRLDLLLDPMNSANVKARVEWCRGYMDGENYIRVDNGSAMLSGQTLVDKISATTTGLASLYEEVKKACWELLVDGNHVPAGTID
jgi:hypothetical protein